MTTYFPDARVAGYEDLIDSMTNHPKDRHVLAAAIAGRADMLVTENLRDFPPESVAPLGITVAGQDDFLLGLLELYPDAVLDALRRQASRYRREPRNVAALLGILSGPGWQQCMPGEKAREPVMSIPVRPTDRDGRTAHARTGLMRV
jgi:hypothetical protein